MIKNFHKPLDIPKKTQNSKFIKFDFQEELHTQKIKHNLKKSLIDV